jgi:hypothetical protein
MEAHRAIIIIPERESQSKREIVKRRKRENEELQGILGTSVLSVGARRPQNVFIHGNKTLRGERIGGWSMPGRCGISCPLSVESGRMSQNGGLEKCVHTHSTVLVKRQS